MSKSILNESPYLECRAVVIIIMTIVSCILAFISFFQLQGVVTDVGNTITS